VRRLALPLLCAVLALASCRPADGISRELGAACQSHADCDERCLPSPRWPAGFCSRDCMTTSQCAAGAACVRTVDGEVCLFSCFDDADCAFLDDAAGLGWGCRQLQGPAGATQVCAPPGVG
jgi:hypothetical protein